MNNEDKILSILETLSTNVQTLSTNVETLSTEQKKTNQRLSNLEAKFDAMETKVDDIDAAVMRIETEHGAKLDALFDGVLQNSERLDRIEEAVTRHEEIIFRRIK